MRSEPVAPQAKEGPRVPWISIATPVLLAGVFMLIWKSPFALLIGVVAPVLAIGQWWESRRRHRRDVESAQDHYESELAQWDAELQEEAERFRAHQRQRHPHPAEWEQMPLWRPQVLDGDRYVRVGLGQVKRPSGRQVVDVPVLANIDSGLVVVGSGQVASGLWASVVAGVLSHLAREAPAQHPHQFWPENQPIPTEISTHSVHICWVESVGDIPHDISHVVMPRAGMWELSVEGITREVFQPDLLSSADARRVVALLAGSLPPTDSETGEAPSPDDRSHAVVRFSAEQWIDLVDDGPHAIIWGQTGSGKSVLIRQIIHSIATTYRPEDLSVVLIDFKGGLVAASTAEYPHIGGHLSDLTPHCVSRAAEGIRAEIRRREQVLADAHVDDISALTTSQAVARTVIIVDEIATLLQQHPEWEVLLGDIASRGRALGLHLVVAGQRIIGHIPRSILANAPLRLCLRVAESNEASEFLPGASAAQLARLRHSKPGHGLIVSSRQAVRALQVVESPPSRAVEGSSRPLWLPELPASVTAPTPTLAVMDEPSVQQHTSLGAENVSPGVVVVRALPGRGSSNLVHRWLEVGHAPILLPHHPGLLLECLRQLRESECEPGAVIAADRIDLVLREVPSATIQWVAESVAAIADLQRVHHRDAHCVITAHPQSEICHALAKTADHTWTLLPGTQESAERMGVPRGFHVTNPPPGRLVVEGALGQCVRPETQTPPAAPAVLPLAGVDCVVAPNANPERLPDVPTVTPAELGAHHRELDQAYLSNRLALVGMGSIHLAPFIRLDPPLPPPGEGFAWVVGPTSWRLARLASEN